MDLYIGVYEGQDASFWCDMFQPDKQIMNLLAASLCRAGDEERCPSARRGSEDPVEHKPGRVGRRFDEEQDLIARILLRQERPSIGHKLVVDTTTRR
jgi:hypothetical protein